MGLAAPAIGLGVVLSLVRGGRLSRLVDAPLRGTWMIILGLGLQFAVDWGTQRGLQDPGGILLLALSFVLILGWLVANRHLRGTVLIFAGFVLNAVVILANGAMPVDIEAIRQAGVADPVIPLGKHEVMTDATLLPYLGDRFPIVLTKTSLSAGDVLLTAGIIPLVHDLMTSQDQAARRRRLRRVQAATG